MHTFCICVRDVCTHVCIGVRVCGCHGICQRVACRISTLLPPCGSEDQTQLVRPGSRSLSLLTHHFLYRPDPNSSPRSCAAELSSLSAGILVTGVHMLRRTHHPLNPNPGSHCIIIHYPSSSTWDGPYQSIDRIHCHLSEGSVGLAHMLQFSGCPGGGSVSCWPSLSLCKKSGYTIAQ